MPAAPMLTSSLPRFGRVVRSRRLEFPPFAVRAARGPGSSYRPSRQPLRCSSRPCAPAESVPTRRRRAARNFCRQKPTVMTDQRPGMCFVVLHHSGQRKVSRYRPSTTVESLRLADHHGERATSAPNAPPESVRPARSGAALQAEPLFVDHRGYARAILRRSARMRRLRKSQRRTKPSARHGGSAERNPPIGTRPPRHCGLSNSDADPTKEQLPEIGARPQLDARRSRLQCPLRQ